MPFASGRSVSVRGYSKIQRTVKIAAYKTDRLVQADRFYFPAQWMISYYTIQHQYITRTL